MRFSRLSAKDQTRTVESSLAVANRSSSGENCVRVGFSMCRPRGEVVHVRLEILDNSRLVGGCDVGTGVVKGERTDGGVVCLEDGFKIER